MSKEIVFECQHCGQWLEAPSDMASLFVECPKCEAIIKVPAVSQLVSAFAPADKKNDPVAADGCGTSLSSTMRIDLPPNFGLPPETPRRRFVIRRKP
jgi:phage FluMu protein Com